MPGKVTIYKPSLDNLSQENEPKANPPTKNVVRPNIQDEGTPKIPLKAIFGKRTVQEQSAPGPEGEEGEAAQPEEELSELSPSEQVPAELPPAAQEIVPAVKPAVRPVATQATEGRVQEKTESARGAAQAAAAPEPARKNAAGKASMRAKAQTGKSQSASKTSGANKKGPSKRKAHNSDRVMFLIILGILAMVIIYAVVLAARGSGGQTTPTATAVSETSAITRISVGDAKKMIDEGQAVLVDTRTADAYERQHAQGAISLPEAQALDLMDTLPKDKTLILYCT
ncbi:MAG: rhodanese-like domain-containing protein [Chloroflexi bacterium]|nr:rhodanese-like domain-containing protein [Chloroflexota bacterium]